MKTMTRETTNVQHGTAPFANFPHARDGWSEQIALQVAQAEGVTLYSDHWEAIRALQEYFARHEPRGVNMREVHDALDERFHTRGGRAYLYLLFPGGPVAQGCRIAGLPVPFLAIDRGFGSVM